LLAPPPSPLSILKKRGENMKESKTPEKFVNPVGHIRDRIIINQSEGLPSSGVFISLNGYAFLAKPGVEVDIPRPVRLMLDTCVKTEMLKDPSGKTYYRDVPKITYQLIKENVSYDEEAATEKKEKLN